jgi:hypothetical protein
VGADAIKVVLETLAADGEAMARAIDPVEAVRIVSVSG